TYQEPPMMSTSGSSANNAQRIRFRRLSRWTSSAPAVRCRESFSGGMTGATGGLGFSGASSRTGETILRRASAITLLSRRAVAALLDQPAQIFFHDREPGDHLLDAFALDPSKRIRHRFLAENGEPFE